MPPRAWPVVLLAAALTAAGCIQDLPLPARERPPHWAQPLDLPGLPNAFRVSDVLLRGAQPGPGGFGRLEELGVRTVVNLRVASSDAEALRGTSIREIRVPTSTWSAGDEEVAAFLAAVSDPDNRPLFVHCRHGSDRTGLMCAAYRIAIEGRPRQDAVLEFRRGGFGFHSFWSNLVVYLERLDVRAIRMKAGLGAGGGRTREPAGAGR